VRGGEKRGGKKKKREGEGKGGPEERSRLSYSYSLIKPNSYLLYPRGESPRCPRRGEEWKRKKKKEGRGEENRTDEAFFLSHIHLNRKDADKEKEERRKKKRGGRKTKTLFISTLTSPFGKKIIARKKDKGKKKKKKKKKKGKERGQFR